MTGMWNKEFGSLVERFSNILIGLDDQSFRIAMALRLGTPVCHPHKCICGQSVDKFGLHGLSCKSSAGRKDRHEMSNDLIKEL